MTAIGLVTAAVAGGFAPHLPLAGGIVIEFRAVPDFPNRNYQLSMSVVVEGHPKKFAPGIGIGVNNGNGMRADKLAEFIAKSVAHDDPGWTFKQRGRQLLVTGWTDPETGRFYPVKDIKFSTEGAMDPMPDHLLPTVHDRRAKG